MSIQGIIWGKPHRASIPDKKAPCPLDNDFTYVTFVIDAYARKIVGWRVSSAVHAGFVLDA